MRALLVALCACGRLGFDGELGPECIGNDDDGDRIPDACDRCPAIPDSAQPDADADGVGDTCDPSAGSDRLALFDPFLGSALDARWQVTGTWVVANSSATASDASSRIAYVMDPTGSELAIRGEILAIGPPARQISLQFGDAVTGEAEYCEVYDESGPRLKLMRLEGTSDYTELAAKAIEIVEGPFTLRLRHGAAGLSCTVEMGGTTRTVEAAESFAKPRTRAWVQAINLRVRLDSFTEVTSDR